MKKLLAAVMAVVCSLMCFAACSSGETAAEETGTTDLKHSVDITLNGDSATCESSGVFIDGGKITITSAGTYVVSGTLNDGMIYVDCVDAGELNLILNNADITNSTSSAIFIKTAQEAKITLYEGSVNTLTDGSTYIYDNPDDNEPDATLFSKEDLVITGTGKLTVNANYANGIVSKDGLKIEAGEYEINAAHHGIKGKDYLVIDNGTITVNAVGDGIKATNYDNSLVGYIEINGGTITISSEDEAIQAVSAVRFNGGTVTASSTNNGIKVVEGLEFNAGSVSVVAEDNALDASNVEVKEECTVLLNGTPYFG